MRTIDCDFFVVGSGMAGLISALHLAKAGKVVLATKRHLADCNTNFAQGGICCVMDPADSFDAHVQDTLVAGAGLCDEAVVRRIVEEAPDGIADLVACGVKFAKTPDGRWDLGREGGHGARRILHAGDIRKTAAYTEIILKQMKEDGIYADILTDEYIADVIHSAPLHDIGKIHVPDSILNKPGRLTDEEFNQMRSHTSAGEDIIERAIDSVGEDSGYLREAKNLARYHHEKWNGKGYPTGLAGEDIPLSARVMAVADVFDALVSRRSYKEPFSIDKAIDIIRSDAGTHFDAKVVEAFLHAEPQIRAVAESNMEKEEQK